MVKSLQVELAEICYYDPQSAEINVQSPQSASTPRTLTLLKTTKFADYSISKDLQFFFKPVYFQKTI